MKPGAVTAATVPTLPDPRHDTLQRDPAGTGILSKEKDRIHDFRSHFTKENLLG